MRSNCGVYVDAGYLLAAAATRVTGTSLRNGITADYPNLLKGLIGEAEALAGLPVLRVNWYDAGPHGNPDAEQEGIGILPRVKLRLGRFGFDGQQKGVDLRIGLDMVAHARNGAVDTIVLVSGDDDLTEAVEEAQVHGVQVIVLAVPTTDGRPHGVSRHLHRAADNLELMHAESLERSVTKSEKPAIPLPSAMPKHVTPMPRMPGLAVAEALTELAASAPPVPAYSTTTGTTATIAPEFERTDEEMATSIGVVAKKVLTSFVASSSPDERAALARARPSIPRDLDRALLMDLSDALSIYTLSDGARTELRKKFWEEFDGGESS